MTRHQSSFRSEVDEGTELVDGAMCPSGAAASRIPAVRANATR